MISPDDGDFCAAAPPSPVRSLSQYESQIPSSITDRTVRARYCVLLQQQEQLNKFVEEISVDDQIKNFPFHRFTVPGQRSHSDDKKVQLCCSLLLPGLLGLTLRPGVSVSGGDVSSPGHGTIICDYPGVIMTFKEQNLFKQRYGIFTAIDITTELRSIIPQSRRQQWNGTSFVVHSLNF